MRSILPKTFRDHARRPVPATLWHYTSLQGLYGIVKNNEIWATDVRFLNDSSEFLHAVELFREVIGNRTAAPGTLQQIAIESAAGLFGNVHNLESNQVFVSSFSTHPDQLSQWRAYGSAAASVCLGFDLKRFVFPDNPLGMSFLAPCIYKRARKLALINRWLDSYCQLASQLRSKNPSRVGSPGADEEAAEKLLGTLELIELMLAAGRLCALMKHHSFFEENEWRLVISESRSRTVPSPHERSTRIGANTLVPYVRIPLVARKGDPSSTRLTHIKLGPHPEPDRAKQGVVEFLKSNGPVDIEITSSAIPFRTW